jgi:hypothetical protein
MTSASRHLHLWYARQALVAPLVAETELVAAPLIEKDGEMVF